MHCLQPAGWAANHPEHAAPQGTVFLCQAQRAHAGRVFLPAVVPACEDYLLRCGPSTGEASTIINARGMHIAFTSHALLSVSVP